MIPSSAAIASAVLGWSPVIVIDRMPAALAVAAVAPASGRGGSIMTTKAPVPAQPDVLRRDPAFMAQVFYTFTLL